MPACFFKLKEVLETRQRHERVVVMAILLAALTLAWLYTVHDPLQARREGVLAQLSDVEAGIQAQRKRSQDLRTAFDKDPDALARQRLESLRHELERVDQRLNEVYGQLVSPQVMSSVLSSILQEDSSLRLLSLENLPPEVLFQNALEATPSRDAPSGEADGDVDLALSVYKHGLSMVFEGSYLETVDYLLRLEALDSNFFWESLEFRLEDHPRARITLRIFTLSTRQEWIGV